VVGPDLLKEMEEEMLKNKIKIKGFPRQVVKIC
jgi:hypothetical protein